MILQMSVAVNSFAESFEYNGILYEIDSQEDRQVSLIDGKNCEGDVIIPDYVCYNGIDYSVVCIKDSAFFYNHSITSVTISKNVKTIGNSAFEFAGYLSYVTILEGTTSIGNNAFKDCALRSISIPKSVTSIGDFVFYRCNELSSLVIPEGVVSIGKRLFGWGGYNLISLTIPSSLIEIGEEAFTSCDSIENLFWKSSLSPSCIPSKKLKNVELADGITNIDDSLFQNCKELTTVILPNSITTIGTRAFGECKMLSTIDIPSSVRHIGARAFEGCDSLKQVIIQGNPVICANAFADSPDIKSIYLNGNTPCRVEPNNPFITGSYESIVHNNATKSEIYDSALCRTKTEISYHIDIVYHPTSNIWKDHLYVEERNFPAGRYKVKIGMLPSPDSIVNNFTIAIYGLNNGREHTLFNPMDPLPVPPFEAPRQYSNTDKYDSILIADQLVVPDYYECIRIVIDPVNYSSQTPPRMILDRIYFEPLEEIPIKSYSGPFHEKAFNNAILYIPEGTMNLYKEADGWRLFNNMAYETTVNDVFQNSRHKTEAIFDIKGQRINAVSIDFLSPSIYIKDGKILYISE